MPYNGAQHTVFNKSVGIAQAMPTDARSYFYDAVNFIMRPYVSTSEVLSYLNLPKYRTGQFPIFINSLGVLNPDGTITGGTVEEWWFKDGVADVNLVQKVAGGVPSGGTVRQSLMKKSGTDYDVEWVSDSPAPEIIYAYMRTPTVMRLVLSKRVLAPTAAGLSVNSPSPNVIVSIAGTGTSVLDLTLTDPVTAGATVTVGYDPGSGNIADLLPAPYTQELTVATAFSVFNPATGGGGATDTTAPLVVYGFLVSPTVVRIVFSEPVDITDATGCSVSSPTNNPIVSVAGTGTNTLDFTVTNDIAYGAIVYFSYVGGTGNIRDFATPTPNILGTLTNYIVVNTVEVPNLNAIPGVVITTPSVGQALVFDAGLNIINGTISGGGGAEEGTL